jgi:hypothetical protein
VNYLHLAGYHLSEELLQLLDDQLLDQLLKGGLAPDPFPESLYSKVKQFCNSMCCLLLNCIPPY